MRSRGGIFTALAAVLAFAAFAAPVQADTQDTIAPQHDPPTAEDGWQAGTCTTDTPECSPETTGQFFTQAAGHTNVGLTQFITKFNTNVLGGKEPQAIVKDIRVDLPTGLSVNPQATPQCEVEDFENEECPSASQVGESEATVSELGIPVTLPAPVYNLVPAFGEPALFGFALAGQYIYLKSDVEWSGDYHEGFTIAVPKSPLGKLLKNRLVFNGRSGDGTFLTNPSTCFDPSQGEYEHTYSTFLRADSVEQPNASFPDGSSYFEAPLPPGVKPTGCGDVPFEPTIDVSPGTNLTDSPAGPAVDLEVPFEKSGTVIANSNVRDANITLPEGMGLNPSAAQALVACTDGQLGKGTRNPVSCPAGSKIGTVSIETPPLPAGSLQGSVYLGQQLSRDPASGNLYRIFLDAESARYGVSVRLIGHVKANPRTGRLTASFNENPQLPFTSVKIKFENAKGVLTTPSICGPNKSTHSLTAWSGSPDSGGQEGGFKLSNAPGGEPCAGSLGARPFAPGFTAQPAANKAKAYSPFTVHVSRPDGQQELKGVDISPPPGATAKLAGIPYCAENAIAAAVGRFGSAERSAPSCPAASGVGIASVYAGSGPTPVNIIGTAYLAGPYKGAPLSLAVITPALAGPFDLGTVVVRVALHLDPETAQIRAVSDQIPDVYGGAKLDVRSIFVNVNRPAFTRNGTNCQPKTTAGYAIGGGADPANPAAFSAVPVADPTRLIGCGKLQFKPKLYLRLFGATKRAKHPRLRAVLQARAQDADIARTSVALPHSLFLDQASLSRICTRVQFAVERCPKKSIYGYAKAFSPLLAKPLRGPVYLRSSNNTLPDMVAHLRGQVTIDLVGRIDSFRGGIRTTFDRVPDVPVKKFILNIPGGKHGLLVASTDLCKKPVRGIVKIKGHNSRRSNRKVKLRTPCNRKKQRHRGKHHRGKNGKHHQR